MPTIQKSSSRGRRDAGSHALSASAHTNLCEMSTSMMQRRYVLSKQQKHECVGQTCHAQSRTYARRWLPTAVFMLHVRGSWFMHTSSTAVQRTAVVQHSITPQGRRADDEQRPGRIPVCCHTHARLDRLAQPHLILQPSREEHTRFEGSTCMSESPGKHVEKCVGWRTRYGGFGGNRRVGSNMHA